MNDKKEANIAKGWIYPNWPAPAHVHAVTTCRQGGVSLPPYDSLNLGDHVKDDPNAVAENRQRLVEALALPHAPLWLNQVHSRTAVSFEQLTQVASESSPLSADAIYSNQPHQVAAILTADCLPVLFCDTAGHTIAAAHAGWRGLLLGVLDETIEKMGVSPNHLMAWLGPAIGPTAFEVGDDVYTAFVAQNPDNALAFQAISPSSIAPQKYLADLYHLARLRLHHCGVTAIYGGDACTVSSPDRFFSYRRDGVTGRMATLIWRDESINADLMNPLP